MAAIRKLPGDVIMVPRPPQLDRPDTLYGSDAFRGLPLPMIEPCVDHPGAIRITTAGGIRDATRSDEGSMSVVCAERDR